MKEIKDLTLVQSLDEQHAVGFTGKINVLSRLNNQLVGVVFFHNGQVIQTQYQGQEGLKAFYQLVIAELNLVSHRFVTEPELVDLSLKHIHFPYSVLRARSQELVDELIEAQKQKPPEDVKLMIDPSFINSQVDISGAEFEVLVHLTEWNKVKDVYQNCPLLEFEITTALVSLRKKKAIRVLRSK